MKIKSVLIAAGLGLVGAITANAQQTVYSINVVGYMTVACPPGFSIIANQLTNSTGGNNITNLNGLPDQTTIYKWKNGSFDIVKYFADYSVWSRDGENLCTDMYLNPGEGAYIYNPSQTTVNLTFTGEVLQGGLANQVPINFSILAGMVPITGGLGTDHGLGGGVDDTIYIWNNATGSFGIYRYFDGYGWSPDGENIVDPQINIGQGFWYYRNPINGTMNWTLNFQIPN